MTAVIPIVEDLLQTEVIVPWLQFMAQMYPLITVDQRQAVDRTIDSVLNSSGKVFFLDAPEGTEKIFLIYLMLAQARSAGKLSLAVESSVIAATLLSEGRIAHFTFKLPLCVFSGEDYTCPLRKNGPLGKILQDTAFIVWDKCTMSHRAHIEAIIRTLKDLRLNQELMVGTTFVFAGGLRQTLPVIQRGTRADIIHACLRSSFLRYYEESHRLRTNMRAHLCGGSTEFPTQLLEIGSSTMKNKNGFITIDQFIGKLVKTVDDLISKVHPDIEN
ncbi:uncharacterized protein LOC106644180 [Copidosoma floridanum]|uniref:uncharacterized protein LOC106644180 n=1 Tax=Copidosoma floridanum TaxID=29053 RepID=UPI0006C978EF|nr:uncharacterized protein LOC106644180 [Copidosoma floridanum]